jgi:hypothetical protein
MRSASRPIGPSLILASAVLLVTSATVSTQQRRRGNDNASFGTPVATSMILEDPDAYFGKTVTVTAGLEQVLSKTAFVVDQRKAVGATQVKAIGHPLLVIAPYLSSPLDPKHYLLVRGQVVKFDPAAIAKAAPDYTLDLVPEASAKYQGQPVLLALGVIDSTYTDLAKKPIPPPTPTDLTLSAAMKIVSPASTALRAAAQEAKPDVVAENVAKLKPVLAQIAATFDGLGQGAAAARVREAATQVVTIETAVAAGNWETAKTSAASLNQTCQSCHAAYRERQDDGTYRFKAATN